MTRKVKIIILLVSSVILIALFLIFIKSSFKLNIKNNKKELIISTKSQIESTIKAHNMQKNTDNNNKQNIPKNNTIVKNEENSNGILFKKGDKGNNIKEIQKLLNKFNYKLDIDGRFGAITRNAVMDFQKKGKLKVTGNINNATLTKLKNLPATKLKQNINIISNTNASSNGLNVSIARERGMIVAHVTTSKPAQQLKVVLSRGGFRNGLETAYSMAKRVHAVIGINGSCIGKGIPLGIKIYNGKIYTPFSVQIPLCITRNGDMFSPLKPTNASDLINQGAYNTCSFGPVLVRNGVNITLSKSNIDTHTNITRSANVRSAIGEISNGNYIIIASKTGVTDNAVAEEFIRKGCKFAYNLDGGGSTALYYNGKILAGGGRAVGDMIYFSNN